MKTCVRDYYKDTTKARAVNNVVCGFYDAPNDTLNFVFPRPFIMTAFTSEANVGAPTQYVNSIINLLSTADQNTYKDLMLCMGIAFAFDTAVPQGTTNGNDAYISGNFSEYMFKFLNTGSTDYNSIIGPMNEVRQFWADEQTTPHVDTLRQRLRELERWLFTNARIEVYNPGGVYQILNATGGGNTAPYATDLIAFMTAKTNKMCVRTVELDLVGSLADSFSNSQFPVPTIPNAILYDAGLQDSILWT
jgi:hypothetical protein